ncbi:MAG TPA: cellulose biosynthesis protein BcsG [Trinickia sp.]|jgi:cellulose synthase operon protein YhjU|nr:cellulose biosynthesis protein BcsG [Trinickia sp.]
MTSWNLYFLLKLYLYATGHLKPLWIANIAFLIALGATSSIKRRWLRVLRHLIGLAIGVPLLYYEAIVPPFSRVVATFSELRSFTFGYWLELAQRFVPPLVLIGVVVFVALYLIVNRWLRIATFLLIALVALPVWNAVSVALTPAQGGGSNGARGSGAIVEQPLDHNAALAAFRTAQAQRQVAFGHLSANANAQFDIIVLHICSLSWDDLDVSQTRNNPMLAHFDYLFTNFSTAASYSGPAAVRVLRASCGQQPHAALYSDAPPQCHLFAELAQAGYTPQVLLNHDGHFDNFLQLVRENIGAPNAPLISNAGAPVSMHAFDSSPIHDDYATLANWYAERAKTPGPVALYYNTLTLHDGNRLVGNDRLTSLASYPQRVTTMMNEFDAFAELVAKSGRRAAIVFVPEHGAALRGDANQIAGLREIPTPRIIDGPVGVRLIGLPGDHGPTTVIDRPSSFLALAQLLSNLVSSSPFAGGATLPRYAENLPQTQMVGENEGTVVMKTASGYAVKTPDNVWIDEK